MAGKAPYTVNDELVGSRDTYVHFVQEPFDQASLVRPYLKWEWTLPSGVVVRRRCGGHIRSCRASRAAQSI